jgi:hypothetical protein
MEANHGRNAKFADKQIVAIVDGRKAEKGCA